MKNKVVAKYLFKKHIKALMIAYLYAIAILLVLPLLIAIISGTLNTFSLGNTIKGIEPGFITTFILGALALMSYEDYKFLIQNGISRNTFFNNQVTSYGSVILIGAVFDEVYFLLVHAFLGGNTFYQVAYGNFIHNVFLSEAMGFLYHILWLAAVVASCMAVGSFLSLFSKKVQRLIIIGGFVAGVVFLSIISSAASTFRLTWIADLAKFILGYQHGEPTTPIFLMLSYLLWGFVMLLISRVFYNRKQIKRI